ncbi:MAG TPA: hypothetical protein VF487_13225 [Chitinophagaceae bacterium]
MKLITLRVPKPKLINVCSFLVTYCIETIASWKDDDIFNDNHFLVVSTKGGGGITTEEKERLIEENLKKNIANESKIELP